MLSTRRLLLLDGIGAIISAISLGVIIPAFDSYFNVQLDVLYILAGIAVVFSIYSLSSYLLSKANWHKFLRIIAVANLSYCVLTGSLIYRFSESVSALAIVYFSVEIMLVVSLAIWELKVAYQK